jgi:putative redox protein
VTGEAKHIVLDWERDMVFRGGEPGGPSLVVDGDNALAPGPMLTLLLAAASCSGSDVVTILEKMRVGLRTLRVEVRGTRRDETPRRYTAIRFEFHLGGEALDEPKARRAIDLSLEKYCSVVASLAPDIAISYGLTLA